uniref:Secreted protein n=1 Tax=Plectus sambesii TaxID=2011161 RepID=A0A914X1P8_9BILA
MQSLHFITRPWRWLVVGGRLAAVMKARGKGSEEGRQGEPMRERCDRERHLISRGGETTAVAMCLRGGNNDGRRDGASAPRPQSADLRHRSCYCCCVRVYVGVAM